MTKSVDVFYQGEGIREIEHIEVGPHHSFSDLKALLVEKHGMDTDAEVLMFIEDRDEPVEGGLLVHEHAEACIIKIHVHRCRHIEVTVTFNGESVEHRFGPGTTIARVKKWAAEHKFGMSPEEASEHMLQIAGSHDRPAPGTHLGSLVSHGKCQLAFDLVPDERVNGHSDLEVVE
jgi:hypothetical protein